MTTDNAGPVEPTAAEASETAEAPAAAPRNWRDNLWPVVSTILSVAVVFGIIVAAAQVNTARNDGFTAGYAAAGSANYTQGVKFGAEHGDFNGGPAVVKVPGAPVLACARGLSTVRLSYLGGGVSYTDTQNINTASLSLGPPDPGPRNQLGLDLQTDGTVHIYGVIVIREPVRLVSHWYRYSALPVDRGLSIGAIRDQQFTLPAAPVIKGVVYPYTDAELCVTLQAPRYSP